jgi:hypothetical protein
MKKIISLVIFIISITTTGFSQESTIYSFFVNIVSEPFRFPLIGLVNIANGNHDNVQLGLVNWNTGNFSSIQAGLVNSTRGNISGVQLGLVNTSAGNLNGWQSGLVNTVANGGQGFQIGLVNASMEKLKGAQIGLVNFVDSIEEGIPIGLISIVRNGGYRAVEYSFSEFYPVNLGLKLGVKRFYTTIFVSYNPFEEIVSEQFAVGFGTGSIIPINNSFFINPELNSLFSFWGNNQQITSFIPYFGYNLSKIFKITAGPSVTWVRSGNDNRLQRPLFRLYEHTINKKNNIVVGARAGVRFQF